MFQYVMKRIMYMFITLFIVISVTFFLVRLLPGTPFNEQKLSSEQIAKLESTYGLDEPIPVQYAKYISGVFQGKFGTSFKNANQKVEDIIIGRIGPSALLGIQSLIFGCIVGLILGIIAALKRNTIWDYLCTIIAVLGVSVPSFVIAAILQLYIGMKLKLLPITWGVPLGSDFRYTWTILPSLAMSVWTISSVARFTRTELVEVLNSDYIVTAKAKGLSKASVIMKHALRNALVPVITMLGPLAASLLTGSLVVERVFAVPGMGDLLVNAINTNDLFVISGVAIVYSVFYIGVILLVDILYGVIDPRIRLSGGN